MEDPMGRASLIPKGGKGRYCHDVLHEVLHFSSWWNRPSQVPKFHLALKTGFYYG